LFLWKTWALRFLRPLILLIVFCIYALYFYSCYGSQNIHRSFSLQN
jgi:hypothetical protein